MAQTPYTLQQLINAMSLGYQDQELIRQMFGLAGGSSDPNFDPIALSPLFGTGSDGAATISSGTTTLTRDMHYTNLTISGSGKLNPSGYRVFVSGTLDISAASAGAIVSNAGNATNASGATAGIGGGQAYSNSPASLPSVAGYVGPSGGTGNTTTGTNPGSTNPQNAGNGGCSFAGGPGGAGTSAGAAGGAPSATLPWVWNNVPLSLNTLGTSNMNGLSFVGGNSNGVYQFVGGSFGGGGGQGGGDGTNAGGGGGGGGGAPGWIWIAARYIQRGVNATAAIFQCNGGNGGNGGNGAGGNAGGGGGGSGGGGGFIFILCEYLLGLTILNALQVNGGNGGNGGNGVGTGKGGAAGGGGYYGNAQILNLGAPSFTQSLFNGGGTAPTAASGTTAGVVGAAGATLQVNL